jgi:succinate-acetate transporter protein
MTAQTHRDVTVTRTADPMDSAITTDTAGATIADPGPLGLAAFAMTTFVLSCVNAGLIDKGVEAVVLPLALFYGGLAQLLAGMWEFRKGNTFGALAFSSYGAFWLSFAGLVKFVAAGLPADKAYQGIGVYLLGWAIFTGYMLIASLRTTLAIIAVFACLFVTFVLLTIGELGKHPDMTKAGGWIGIVTAVVAWYASFAGVLNLTWKRSLIPTWPRA